MAITPSKSQIEAAGLEYVEPTEIVRDTGPRALNLLAQAILEAPDRALAGFTRGQLPDTSNMQAMTNPGDAGVWQFQATNISARPIPGSGSLVNLPAIPPQGGVQIITGATYGEMYIRTMALTGWADWVAIRRPWLRGLVDRSKHADDLKFERDAGLWGVSPANAAADIGLPTTEVGTLEVRWIAGNTTPNTQQEWRPESGAVWSRYCSLGAWGAWRRTDAAPYSEPDHAEREIRVSRMRQRLGRISVGDKGAVALVCDHGTQNFRDILLPMLQERDLTCTLSINAGRDKPTYMHSATDGDVTWAEIAAWADAGIEIANHSMDHTGASGYEGTYEEIVQARIDLEARIGAPVDSWVQPGTFTEGDFDGFGAGGQPEHYWSKLAGRMLLASHAVVTGTLSGDFWPTDGQIPIGAKGYWLDTGSVSGAKTFTEKAALDRTRCLLRLHPAALGDAVSVADMTAVLDDLVAKRDAGRLAILTLREWAIAQP